MRVKALILAGDGINCEKETAQALTDAGAESIILDINNLLLEPKKLQEFDILALPGGFSFGDEIHSGQVLAIKMKKFLLDELHEFIKNKKLIIGICNGFQVLLKLGLLPNDEMQTKISLGQNQSSTFINTWVEIKTAKSNCIWTKNLEGRIQLPIRHGEGRIVIAGTKEEQIACYESLLNRGQIALSYQEDINGSFERIAGLCNPEGTILGLMPHPEAATNKLLSPYQSEFGKIIFNNAIHYLTCEETL